jgi:tetratricopeptide (TPR) repeat protein
MGLLKIFGGKEPEAYEQKGDDYCRDGAWGKAKIEYDKALSKLDNIAQGDDVKERLQGKIRRTKEALALEHKNSAEELLAAGYHDDARQYVALGLELTENHQLRSQFKVLSQRLEQEFNRDIEEGIADFQDDDEAEQKDIFEKEGDEYFRALLAGLPEDIQQAYANYGEDFKLGYLALNQGDFERAASYLAEALQRHPSMDSYIPVELATAYMNLAKNEEAQILLETFLQNRQDALPGYQLLCEIYWETHAFDKAERLLAGVPQELTESVAFCLLRGETLFHAGRYSEAKSFYLDFLDAYDWNEPVARALAKSLEALDETEKARDIYRNILNRCRGCGSRIDLDVKRKYADLSFSSGQNTAEIMELYFSLAQEDKPNAANYYQKISRICLARGDEQEARRFRLIAEKLASER